MIGVALASATSFLDMYATQPLLPEFLREFHTTKAIAGLTLTAMSMGVALMALPTGLFADILGRKRVIVSAMLLLAGLTAAAAFSRTIDTLVAWRFVQGLVMPAILVTSVAYISEEFPAHRAAMAFAAYTSGGILGGFAGRYVTAAAADASNWHVAFMMLGGANLIGAILVFGLLPRSRVFQREGSIAQALVDMRSHLTNARFLATCIVGGNSLLSLVAAYTFITYHLSEAPYHFTTGQIGNIFLAYLVGAIVTFRAGRLIANYGNRLVILVAALTVATGALVMLIPSALTIVAGLLIITCGVFVSQTAAQGNIRNVVNHGTAIAAALYLVVYYTLGGLGAVVPAWIARNGAAWQVAIALVVVLQTISIAIIIGFVRRAARSGEAVFPVY